MGDKGLTRGPKQLLSLCFFRSMSAQAVLAGVLELLGKEKIAQLKSYQGQASQGSVLRWSP